MALRPLDESTKDYDRVVATNCNNQCESSCGMLVYVKEGRVVDIMGDTRNPNAYGALCCKGTGSFQHIYNPLRVKYPMIRKTLDDDFQRVSWDDALDFTAERLLKVRQKYGPEALMIHRTGRSDYNWKMGAKRFSKLWGTPNVVGQGPICCESPGIAGNYTWGAKELFRLTNPTMDWVNSKCILVAGSNMAASEVTTANWLLNAKENGATIIVIDPRFNSTMAKADIAMRLRPNTDAALALAMINVVLKENLQDDAFIKENVDGLAEWMPIIEDMPPERAERITWVPKETIVEAARAFAMAKPASMTGCLGTAQTYNSNNINRCYQLLAAITGNVGIEGGGVNWLHNCRPPDNPGHDIPTYPRSELDGKMDAAAAGYGLNEEALELANRGVARPPITDKLVPWLDISAAAFPNAILTQKPYPIRAVWWNGNMLAQMPNTNKYSAGMKANIDIAIHMSWHPNFTYHHAHVAFPITSWVEREGQVHHGNNRLNQWYNKAIDENWECRNDVDVVCGIADRVGLGEYFPFRDSRGRADLPAWVTFFNKQEPFTAGIVKETMDPETTPPGGVMWPAMTEKEAMTFETPDAKIRGKWIMYKDGENYPGSDKRFPTETGKIECASAPLEKLGWDRLPQHREGAHTAVSAPEEFKDYPLVLCTGRLVSSFHEMGHWWPWTDELEPEKFAQIHPRLASVLGIRDGDIVVLESKMAEIESFAWVTEEIDPREIWVPASTDEYQPFVPGITNRNVSYLIDDIVKDPVYNQPEFKAQLINIRKKGDDREKAIQMTHAIVDPMSDYPVKDYEFGQYQDGVAQGGAPTWDKEAGKVMYEGQAYETGNLIEKVLAKRQAKKGAA